VYSAVRGMPWVSQPVEFDGSGALHGIDFSDASNGVACGASSTGAASAALCFRTSDGGSRWQRSEMSVPEGGMRVDDVALCNSGAAWAVASGEGSRLAFLRSLDGGARWEEVSVPGVQAGRIRALSHDAAR